MVSRLEGELAVLLPVLWRESSCVKVRDVLRWTGRKRHGSRFPVTHG